LKGLPGKRRKRPGPRWSFCRKHSGKRKDPTGTFGRLVPSKPVCRPSNFGGGIQPGRGGWCPNGFSDATGKKLMNGNPILTDYDIHNANFRNRRSIETNPELEYDSRRSERLDQSKCRVCFHGGLDLVPPPPPCAICEEANHRGGKLCPPCADRNLLCLICAGDIDGKERESRPYQKRRPAHG
jgi:hypothetical protein